MSRNNTARTKEKKKKLRLKSFHKRVIEKRSAKLAKKRRAAKGVTIMGDAEKAAGYMPSRGIARYLNNLKKPPSDQRKRRKLARQTGRYKQR